MLSSSGSSIVRNSAAEGIIIRSGAFVELAVDVGVGASVGVEIELVAIDRADGEFVRFLSANFASMFVL